MTFSKGTRLDSNSGPGLIHEMCAHAAATGIKPLDVSHHIAIPSSTSECYCTHHNELYKKGSLASRRQHRTCFFIYTAMLYI